MWVCDQRGYNPSEKPRPVAAYNLDLLIAVVVTLIQTTALDRDFPVGHNRGAAVVWRVAANYPGALERLVILDLSS